MDSRYADVTLDNALIHNITVQSTRNWTDQAHAVLNRINSNGCFSEAEQFVDVIICPHMWYFFFVFPTFVHLSFYAYFVNKCCFSWFEFMWFSRMNLRSQKIVFSCGFSSPIRSQFRVPNPPWCRLCTCHSIAPVCDWISCFAHWWSQLEHLGRTFYGDGIRHASSSCKKLWNIHSFGNNTYWLCTSSESRSSALSVG